MKWSKIILGLLAILTSLGSAIGAIHEGSNRVWYINHKHQPASSLAAFTCPAGHTGCLGTSGPSAGRQLYQDSALSIPLGYTSTK